MADSAMRQRLEPLSRDLPTRRQFLRRTTLLLAGAAATGSAALSCAPSQPAPQPTTAPAAPAPTQPPAKPATAPTTAPASAPTIAPAAAAPTKPAAAAPTQAPAASGGPIKRGGTLTVVVQNDWVSLDPVFNSAEPNGTNMLYGEWIDWVKDPKTGQWGPQPNMVAEWDMRPNEIVLKLQKGIKFHDGTDWDAKAAKWNLDRMIFLPSSLAASWFGSVDGSKEDQEALKKAGAEQTFNYSSKAIEVVDDYTVKLHLKSPLPALLAVMSNATARSNPVSPAAYNKLGKDQFNRNPVGAGPFRFVEWKPATQVVLERNPDYWRKGADGKALPYLDKIVYRLIIDDSVRLLELKSGSSQFMELVQGKDVAAVRADPNLVYQQSDSCGNNYRMPFDGTNKESPFRHLKLRQALLYAVDREAMAKTLGFEAGTPLQYMLPKGSFAYDDTLPFYGYDKAKAQALVKEVLTEDPSVAGSDGKIAVMLTVIDRAVDKMQAEMIQQMADAVGFKMKIEILERAAFVSKLVSLPGKPGGAYHVATVRNPMSPADPDEPWRGVYHSQGGQSYFHYDPLDTLIDKGAGTYDVAERKKIYREIQQKDYELALFGYLWVQNWNWLYTKKLKNWPEAITNRWLFTESWLE